MPGFVQFPQFTELTNYHPLPADRYVVITDIQGSTEAISKGYYKEVNSVSTASVVAVLNVFTLFKIPYVFDGDGATLCVPPSHRELLKSALAASR